MSGSRIGRGTSIRGAIRGEGDLEIEGRVEGLIELDGDLEVAAAGRVTSAEGAVAARRITVHGAVAGSLTGREAVVLEEGARVVGDLSAPSIGIRPGGMLRGHVSTEGEAVGRAPARGASRAAAPSRAARAPAREPARAVAPPPPRAARAPARVAAPEPMVEEVPRTRGRAAAPAPVMPALKKGQKGAMKKKGTR